MVLRAAFGHSDVSITQKYLEVEEDAVLATIRKCDFSRCRKPKIQAVAPIGRTVATAA
jgi:hypothetical protein